MGTMINQEMTEREIDDMVVSRAGKHNAWENWQEVNPITSISLDLSEKSIEGLKSIARLKGEKGINSLLKRWVDERLIYEQRIINETKKATG